MTKTGPYSTQRMKEASKNKDVKEQDVKEKKKVDEKQCVEENETSKEEKAEVHNEEKAEIHNESAQIEEENLKPLIIDSGKVVHAMLLSVKPPIIVGWIVEEDKNTSVYKFIRADKITFSCTSFLRAIMTVTRDDFDEIIRIGMRKYVEVKIGPFFYS